MILLLNILGQNAFTGRGRRYRGEAFDGVGFNHQSRSEAHRRHHDASNHGPHDVDERLLRSTKLRLVLIKAVPSHVYADLYHVLCLLLFKGVEKEHQMLGR